MDGWSSASRLPAANEKQVAWGWIGYRILTFHVQQSNHNSGETRDGEGRINLLFSFSYCDRRARPLPPFLRVDEFHSETRSSDKTRALLILPVLAGQSKLEDVSSRTVGVSHVACVFEHEHGVRELNRATGVQGGCSSASRNGENDGVGGNV